MGGTAGAAGGGPASAGQPAAPRPLGGRAARGQIRIRQMTAADVEPLRWVIYRAYYQVLLDLYGPDSASQYEVRSVDFMAMYLRRDAAGSLVAETEDGGLAGGLFCFVWGEVGWFGSLAVAPEWQGHKVAQRLTAAAIEYLRARGCRRIGLETWPTAPLTRHLYTKLGFELCRPTIKLSRGASPAPPTARPGWHMDWTGPGEAPALVAAVSAVERVTERLNQGGPRWEARVAYGAEVRVPVASGFAEVGVLRDAANEPLGFALAYTRKPSSGPVGALDVRLLLIAPAPDPADQSHEEAALDAILASCDARATWLGARSVTCDVNLRYSRASGLLRERGFRPIYELVRMEIPTEGIDLRARSPLIECARWAG